MRAAVLGALFALASASLAIGQVILPEEGDARAPNDGRIMIMKVDPETVGATQFVVGVEVVPVGAFFPAHRHPNQEEILFVHKGTLTVAVGTATAREAVAGSLVFIPKNTCVAVKNAGSGPATFVFAFPQVGIERFFRRVRPKAGEPSTTMEQRTVIRQDHRHEIDFACQR